MPTARWDLERLAADVAVVAGRALPRDAFFAEVGARVRRVVDCDALCWHTLDPTTQLMTSATPHELLAAGVFDADTVVRAGTAIAASEYLEQDVNAFAVLARRRVPAATLGQATGGRPERSARFRDVLAPAGIPYELRAAFASRGRPWGAVHVARREERGDFTPEDVAALARIAPAVAEGIRLSLRFDAARAADAPGAPGMVVLDGADRVELATPTAREMLDALHHPYAPGSEDVPPAPLVALAGHARRRGRGEGVALPSPLGWITLHASLPDGPAGGRVAMVLERSSTPQATAVRLEAHGVTAREREIAALLAGGRSNAAIAALLVLSPYTVQDHIKSLFEKTGVRSRQELVARVFLEYYAPRLMP